MTPIEAAAFDIMALHPRTTRSIEAILGRYFPASQPIWTQQQVADLFDRQMADNSHPYTCGNRRNHPVVMGDKGVLIPTIYGWICPFCDYRQNWSHETNSQEKSAP